MRLIVSLVMFGLSCYAALNTTGLLEFVAFGMVAIFAMALGQSVMDARRSSYES